MGPEYVAVMVNDIAATETNRRHFSVRTLLQEINEAGKLVLVLMACVA